MPEQLRVIKPVKPVTQSEIQKKRESIPVKLDVVLEPPQIKLNNTKQILSQSETLSESSQSKSNFQKTSQDNRPIGVKILSVLNDDSGNARDKSDTIESIISKEKGLLSISLNNYVEIIKLYENIKNIYLRDSVQKILTATDIENYKKTLFEYFLDQKTTRKLNLNEINAFVFKDLGFANIIDSFLTKNNEEIQ